MLAHINCKIPVDGVVVVMGPSGSGKSTLLRLLSFVERPDEGTIDLKLNGDSFRSPGNDRPWPRVTCVFQKQFLWPHLTVLQNLRLPLEAARHQDVDERVAKMIDLFEMSGFVNRFPNEVSGGQAQRAALARALVLDPELILIDEPHGGLDLEQQSVLNRHLVDLSSSGIGLFIVTHSLDFAQVYADHLVIVEDGTISEMGPREILEHPTSLYLRRSMGVAGVAGGTPLN
ncbi:MAG: ATP-binding cassette domain-containing protein [Ignavibacteriales bacterium]|nr:ATP-binding cassette domain-containing protein [Ignavibacteriales bacterium]